MSILNKLKETAVTVATKLHMDSTVSYLVKENPELATTQLLTYAIANGATNIVQNLVNTQPLDENNVNTVVQALSQTPPSQYSTMLRNLMHEGLIQENTDFSKFLEMHCKKTGYMEEHNQVEPFVLMGHMGGKHGDFTPSSRVVSDAVKDNIGLISYDIANKMMNSGLLKDEGDIYTDALIGGTSKAKMTLAGIAANADNLGFARAWDSNQFKITTNDVIATMDFAARANKRYLCVEDIEKMKQKSDLNENIIRKTTELEHFSGKNTINIALTNEAKFSLDENSVIGKHYGNIRPPAVVGTKTENEWTYAWYDYSPKEIKTVAERASYLVGYQEKRISNAQKQEIDNYIVSREKLFDYSLRNNEPDLEYKGLSINVQKKESSEQNEPKKNNFSIK